MSKIALIDVGGTSIKFGTWDGHELAKTGQSTTPATLTEFYQVLQMHVNLLQHRTPIAGVGISIPGSVNKQTGQIEGKSAIDYIHGFDIQSALTQQLHLPVTLENDANCAALAELTDGAGQDVSNLLFMIIGTISGMVSTCLAVNSATCSLMTTIFSATSPHRSKWPATSRSSKPTATSTMAKKFSISPQAITHLQSRKLIAFTEFWHGQSSTYNIVLTQKELSLVGQSPITPSSYRGLTKK
jgi:hypothetical protein